MAEADPALRDCGVSYCGNDGQPENRASSDDVAGRLARRDPEIVARAFVGSVHHFVVFDLLFQAQDTMPMPEETFLRGVVDLLFRGVDPGGST